MRISDLLGNLKLFAVAPEQSESVQDFVGDIQNRPDVEKIDPETKDNADTKTMVAPLQQKLELLKKAVDVDSYYDEEQDTDKKIASAPTQEDFSFTYQLEREPFTGVAYEYLITMATTGTNQDVYASIEWQEIS